MNSLSVSLSQAVKFLRTGNLLVKKKPRDCADYNLTPKIQAIATKYLGTFNKKTGEERMHYKFSIGSPLQLLCGRQKIWHCPKCNVLEKSISSKQYHCRSLLKPLVFVPSEIKDAGKEWEITAEAEK